MSKTYMDTQQINKKCASRRVPPKWDVKDMRRGNLLVKYYILTLRNQKFHNVVKQHQNIILIRILCIRNALKYF